jgi:hypothetical protein
MAKFHYDTEPHNMRSRHPSPYSCVVSQCFLVKDVLHFTGINLALFDLPVGLFKRVFQVFEKDRIVYPDALTVFNIKPERTILGSCDMLLKQHNRGFVSLSELVFVHGSLSSSTLINASLSPRLQYLEEPSGGHRHGDYSAPLASVATTTPPILGVPTRS